MIGIGNLDSSGSESDEADDTIEKYFVTIQVEETFLRWLDDPDFIEPLDVIQKVTQLIQTPAFVTNVVLNEVSE